MSCSEIKDPIDAVYWSEAIELEEGFELKDYVEQEFKGCNEVFELRLKIADEYYEFENKLLDETMERFNYCMWDCNILSPFKLIQIPHFSKYRNKELSLDEAVNECIDELQQQIKDGKINENDFR